MSAPEVRAVPLDKIKVEGRLREVDKVEVEKLAASMSELGQITPIELRAKPDGEGLFHLIAGAHRVAAATANGEETVLAVLFDGDADDERLREIDENLYRHELTAYDQANFLEERKQIWERIKGKVRRGRPDGRKLRQVGAIKQRNDLFGFYEEVGDLFAIPRRTVQRALERKRCIIKPIWEQLRGTKEAKNGALLDKLADTEPGDQKKLLDYALSSKNSFAQALQYYRPVPVSKRTSVTQMIKKIQGIWQGWDAEERRIFLREVGKLK